MAKIKIPDGNAFYLRITGIITYEGSTENAHFGVVRNMIVNFVRRGRDAQEFEIDDDGKVVAECDGTLACGLYGVEMKGGYSGQPWRCFEKDVFKIVDESETADEPTEIINGVPVYDVDMDVTFGGNGVTSTYVENAIDAHDADEDAHAELFAEKVDDVTLNGTSIVREVTEGEKTKRKAVLDSVINKTDNTDGMGKIVLVPDESFASQLTQTDTIYVIRYDFDLGGDGVTIPEGCVLRFDGGSLSNGTILFQDTIIEGNASILTDINASSTIGNEIVELEWFGLVKDDENADNGARINEVCAVFKDVSLGIGTYYFSTPIVMSHPLSVTILAELTYNGEYLQPSVTISSGYTSKIRINRINGNPTGDFTAISDTSSIGINLLNCNNCDISVGSVSFFREGIRVAGDGTGCCYNAISVQLIANCNIAIRLYQVNGGWSNQNIFYGGRFTQTSAWESDTKPYIGVYVKGADAGDTYDTCNNLTFVGWSFEKSKTAYYLNNTKAITIIGSRTERAETVYKLIGTSELPNILYGYTYGNTSLYDLEGNTAPISAPLVRSNRILDIDADNFVPVSATESRIKLGGILDPDTGLINSGYGSITLNDGTVTHTGVYGVHLDLSNYKGLRLFKLVSSHWQRFYVSYLDGNGNVITSDYDTDTGRPRSSMFIVSGCTFKSGTNSYDLVIKIPEDVDYVNVGFGREFDFFRIYCFDGGGDDIAISPYTGGSFVGTTAERPTYGDLGTAYMDTTLGYPIWWNGSAWVDSTGATV